MKSNLIEVSALKFGNVFIPFVNNSDASAAAAG